MSRFGSAARRLAAQTPRFFVCNQCLHSPPSRYPVSKILNTIRSITHTAPGSQRSRLRTLGGQRSAKGHQPVERDVETAIVEPSPLGNLGDRWLAGERPSVDKTSETVKTESSPGALGDQATASEQIRVNRKPDTAKTENLPGRLGDQLAADKKAKRANEAKKKGFPELNSRAVGYWLLGSAASVFGIVVFGGLTRLTESGLSITEWKPVTGSLPPMSAEDWDSEFTKYRASPEFKLLNPHMTLDEFKKIYFMEWTHRVWGRFIGLSFALPTIYFIARRRVTRGMALNLIGITALIGFQGFIGWWMVKSGLKDDLFAPGSHPRVSQYRLTAHLGTAFICYSWMLLSGLSILRGCRFAADPVAANRIIGYARNGRITRFRRAAFAVPALVFLTAMSGGLVAGLDAGLIYNEFPKMGLGLTPPKSELWDTFYSRREDRSDLWWRNMLENPSTVQMNHRILAVSTFCAILALFAYSRTGRIARKLHPSAKKASTGLVHLVTMQAALGISTLIYMVPIPLAAAHQAGSLAVLTGALVLAHRLHVSKATARRVGKQLTRRLEAENPSEARRVHSWLRDVEARRHRN